MNISLKNVDAVSALLKVVIEKNDYTEPLKTSLRKIRQKAAMPGFRAGMVPLELVKKMYGKQALIEEINRILPEQINTYMRDNQIKIFGEMLPNETEQKKIDFDVDEDFEFCYDLALSPNIDIQLSKDDSLETFKVIIDDESVENQIDTYRKMYGKYETVDIIEAGDMVKGTLTELEGNAAKTDGIVVEDAVLMPLYIKGKMEQKKFLGVKTGESIVFNPYKAYKGAEAELSSLLRIERIATKKMKSDFSFEVKEITRNKPAELDQAFFDKVFGKDTIKSEAELSEHIKESLTRQYAMQTAQKANNDIRAMLLRKVDIMFADNIIKRWLLLSDEKMTEEKVESDYPKVVEELKFQLIKEKLLQEHNINVSEEEVEAMAKRMLMLQYAQYGITSISDEDMDMYVKNMLSNKKTINNISAQTFEEKLLQLVKDLITIKEQEVTIDDFLKNSSRTK